MTYTRSGRPWIRRRRRDWERNWGVGDEEGDNFLIGKRFNNGVKDEKGQNK